MNNSKSIIKFNNQLSPDILEFVNFTNQCLTQSTYQYAYQKGFEQGQSSANIIIANNPNIRMNTQTVNQNSLYNSSKKNQSNNTKNSKYNNKIVNCSLCNYQFESSYQGKNNILCKRCMNNNK